MEYECEGEYGWEGEYEYEHEHEHEFEGEWEEEGEQERDGEPRTSDSVARPAPAVRALTAVTGRAVVFTLALGLSLLLSPQREKAQRAGTFCECGATCPPRHASRRSGCSAGSGPC